MDNLINEAKKGSQKAFTIIYDKNIKSVRWFIAKRLRSSYNDYLVEDIAQETFIKAFKNINKYDSEYKLHTWLFTIAKNLVIDNIRSYNRISNTMNRESISLYKNESMTETDSVSIIEDDTCLYNLIQDNEIKVYVNNLLDGYDATPSEEKYIKVLKMKYINDMKYGEIGDELNISYGTIKGWVNMIKKRLKDNIDIEYYNNVKERY